MDREKIIKGLKYLHDVKRWTPYESDASVTARRNITGDALALLKEQEEIIKELQNAYGYLQDQFFDTQDKLLKEQEAETEWCERCGRVRLKSKWEGRWSKDDWQRV